MNNKVLHPRALEPVTLLMIVLTSVVGAIIGIQLITTLGISANTSIVGAIFAMILEEYRLANSLPLNPCTDKILFKRRFLQLHLVQQVA